MNSIQTATRAYSKAIKNKQAVKKANAKQFFNDLIVSLTKEKSKWTATERMQFNRVSAFLNA